MGVKDSQRGTPAVGLQMLRGPARHRRQPSLPTPASISCCRRTRARGPGLGLLSAGSGHTALLGETRAPRSELQRGKISNKRKDRTGHRGCRGLRRRKGNGLPGGGSPQGGAAETEGRASTTDPRERRGLGSRGPCPWGMVLGDGDSVPGGPVSGGQCLEGDL